MPQGYMVIGIAGLTVVTVLTRGFFLLPERELQRRLNKSPFVPRCDSTLF